MHVPAFTVHCCWKDQSLEQSWQPVSSTFKQRNMRIHCYISILHDFELNLSDSAAQFERFGKYSLVLWRIVRYISVFWQFKSIWWSNTGNKTRFVMLHMGNISTKLRWRFRIPLKLLHKMKCPKLIFHRWYHGVSGENNLSGASCSPQLSAEWWRRGSEWRDQRITKCCSPSSD